MEEAVDKEAQRDELTKLFGETMRKLSVKQNELDQLRNQNRVSLGSSVKEIQNLEKTRQALILELQEVLFNSRPNLYCLKKSVECNLISFVSSVESQSELLSL